MMQPPQPQGFSPQQTYVWMKALETKVNNLLREVDILKEDFMKKNANLKQQLKTTTQDLLDMKHQQAKTQQTVDLIIKELKQTAGKEQLDVIKRYMEFWNPLNFVTQRDIERIIETKMEEKRHSNQNRKKQKTLRKQKH